MNIHFYLRPPGKKQTIQLSFSLNGSGRRRLSTGEKISPKEWNENTQRPRTKLGRTELITLTHKLDWIQDEMKEAYRLSEISGNPLDIEGVERKALALLNKKSDSANPKESNDLLEFVERFISESTNEPSTIAIYKTALTHIKNFVKHTRLSTDLKDIDLNFNLRFREFLKDHGKDRGVNTIDKNIRQLTTFLHAAAESNKEVNQDFLIKTRGKKQKWRAPVEETDQIYLSVEDQYKIYALDLSDKSVASLDRVRDMFLLGCCTGLRDSDMRALRPSHIRDGILQIRPKKTPKVEVVVPLYESKMAMSILAKWGENWPRYLSNKEMNKDIKELVRLAGVTELVPIRFTKGGNRIEKEVPKFTKVTTHTMRRSFATNMLSKYKNMVRVMAMTGHVTQEQFVKYIRSSTVERARLIEYVEPTLPEQNVRVFRKWGRDVGKHGVDLIKAYKESGKHETTDEWIARQYKEA